MGARLDLVAQVGGATEQALYFRTTPDATFATAHLPQSAAAADYGVIMCPPLAWDDLCTYRARRAWAQAMAEAGHPAVRLDLPGVGDSGGSPYSPGLLSAWTEAVGTAAAWLRDEVGCTRVAAVGIGFGGVLAWLAAAEGAPIDDLALWAVPLRGRQLVRELRAAALISIDRNVLLDDQADGSAAGDGGELMDEAGQVITSETLAALSAIDLQTLELSEPGRRRALLFQRPGNAADTALNERVTELGLDVTVAPGDEFEAMMQYVQTSVRPSAAIAASIEWLAAPAQPAVSSDSDGPGFPARVGVSGSIELECDGVVIRERLVELQLAAGPINGVITEPVGAPSAGLTAVFFGGGSDRRIGLNRMWVDTARRWAALGLTAVRMDMVGIGDSPGDEREWDQLIDHYRSLNVERTLELLDQLEQLGLPNRFVLTGFCSGGFKSLNAALRDRRIAGVFAMSLPFFRWTWWTTQIRDTWLDIWEPRPGDGPVKVALARVLKRAVGVIHEIQHRVVALGQYRRSRADHALEHLNQQGTELLLLLRPTSYAYEQLSQPRRKARIARLQRVQVYPVPSNDARFRPLRVQDWINHALEGALGRVLETHAPSVPLQIREARGTGSGASASRSAASSLTDRPLAAAADGTGH